MAKRGRKSGVNKSQSIRDYVAAHPGEGPTAVTAALKDKGIKVTPQFVSMVTSKARGGKRRKRRGRPAGSAAASNGVSLESLKAAKKYLDQMGDAKKAKAAIDLLSQLLG